MRFPRAMLVLVMACASTQQGPRVAVLPETWASERPASAVPAAPRITQALRAHQMSPIADDTARDALAMETGVCIEDLPCLRRVGERLGAKKLVTLKLAELGATVAVQVTVIDVRRAAREATMREVVNPNEAPRLAATLDELGARVARQTAPERRERSRRWFWVGGGVVLGAAVIATALILTAGDDNPDSTIVPP